MIRAFLDSDVILDFLLDREPFAREAGVILAIAERRSVLLFTSACAILNVYYVAARLKDKRSAEGLVRDLRRLVSILPVNDDMIDEALATRPKDFEDRVQYSCAEYHEMDFIVTRNTKDYPRGALPAVTPTMFLKTLPAA